MLGIKTNPTTHRMIQTLDGTIAISREQKGIPLKEYFENIELPNNLENAVVHTTEKGLVLTPPDQIPWNEHHNEKVEQNIVRIKKTIDERGYYSKLLDSVVNNLHKETGVSVEEVKAIVSQAFEQKYEISPFNYLQQQRELQGLPTLNGRSQKNTYQQER